MKVRARFLALAAAFAAALLLSPPLRAAELLVEIITPESGTFEGTTAQAVPLRAVAYLVTVEATTEVDADITWSFGDGNTTAGLSYTAHRWESEGLFPVSAAASYGALQASASAQASIEEDASALVTTSVHGSVPESFASGYFDNGGYVFPTNFSLLARRVSDGLMVWNKHTLYFRYTPPTNPPPGMYYCPPIPPDLLPYQDGDVYYVFRPGDLPPGTYELFPYGSLSIETTRGIGSANVTVQEEACPYDAAPQIRRDMHDPFYCGTELFACGTPSGKVFYVQPAPDGMDDTIPAAGVLVQATGFSISGCQTVTAADGSYTIGGVGMMTAQVAGYATARPSPEGGSVSVGEEYYPPSPHILLYQNGTPSWGRVAGTFALQDATGCGRSIRASSCYLDFTNASSTEYSFSGPAGSMALYVCGKWDVPRNPYGRASSPPSPIVATVPAMGTAGTDIVWGNTYGVAWGKITNTDGDPQPVALARFWVGQLEQQSEACDKTDENGYYVIRLAPGSYSVRGEQWAATPYGPSMFSPVIQQFDVVGGRTVRLDIVLDPDEPVYWPW